MLMSSSFAQCLIFHQEHVFSMPFGPIITSVTQTVIFSNTRAGSAPLVCNNIMASIIGKSMLLLFIGVQFEWSLCFLHFCNWNPARLTTLKLLHKPLWMMFSCTFPKVGSMIWGLSNYTQMWPIQHLATCSTAFNSNETCMESSRPPTTGICISNKVSSAMVLFNPILTPVFSFGMTAFLSFTQMTVSCLHKMTQPLMIFANVCPPNFFYKTKAILPAILVSRSTHMTEPDGSITITMTQPSLINQILEDVGYTGKKVTQKYMPATQVLQPNPSTAPFDVS